MWLRFNTGSYEIYCNRYYSVSFFKNRLMARKKHQLVESMWKSNNLGDEFLFLTNDIEYHHPKLIIKNMDENYNHKNSLNDWTYFHVVPPKIIDNLYFFHSSLNVEQKTAVINILKGEGKEVPYIIFGPPGTGKTVILTETIIQLYYEFPKSK